MEHELNLVNFLDSMVDRLTLFLDVIFVFMFIEGSRDVLEELAASQTPNLHRRKQLDRQQ